MAVPQVPLFMKKLERLLNPFLFLAIGVVARLLPHLPNFAPISAMALFGGVYIKNKKFALAAPLISIFISDYLLLYINPFGSKFIDLSTFYPPQALLYSGIQYVYGSFLISSLIGLWLRNHKNWLTLPAGALACSVQFFLITNAGVWLSGSYSHGLSGLWQSYLAGLPFFRGTFFGDFFYTTLFFGGWELLNAFVEKKKAAIVKVNQ